MANIVHTYRCQEFESVVEEGDIIYQKEPEKHVARIIFNRPHRLNSVTIAGLDYISHLIREAEKDDEVKVVILEGNGPCFGTGADADELGFYIGYGRGQERPPSQRRRMYPDRDVVFGDAGMEQSVFRCLKATICQVHGYCYGGHLQLAAAADIVVASEDALFTHPAWRYLGPIFNFAELIETVGLKKAKEMVLTCRPLTAVEAERFGLVTRVVSREDLKRTADEYAQAISVLPLDGITIGKTLMQQVLEARGFGVSTNAAWMGHGWITNLRYDPEEWNFMRARRDLGLTKALEERDQMIPPYFRMGKARNWSE